MRGSGLSSCIAWKEFLFIVQSNWPLCIVLEAERKDNCMGWACLIVALVDIMIGVSNGCQSTNCYDGGTVTRADSNKTRLDLKL
jgi:hypothetical protein